MGVFFHIFQRLIFVVCVICSIDKPKFISPYGTFVLVYSTGTEVDRPDDDVDFYGLRTRWTVCVCVCVFCCWVVVDLKIRLFDAHRLVPLVVVRIPLTITQKMVSACRLRPENEFQWLCV